jgi:hypothetical protein
MSPHIKDNPFIKYNPSLYKENLNILKGSFVWWESDKKYWKYYKLKDKSTRMWIYGKRRSVFE